MNEVTKRVLDLLGYIEQVESLKIKPVYAVPTDFFVAYQCELKGLPELQFNLQVEGDDVWLRIPRLREIAAPEPDENLRPWVTLPKSPEKTPSLKNETVICGDQQQAVQAELADYPEIKGLFAWYVDNQWNPWATTERPRRRAIAIYGRLFSLQQTIESEGAETQLELVWGIGYAVWKKESSGKLVKHPLLVQACEISLNEKTFDLEVRPRDIEPRLEVDCYAELDLPGVRPLEAFWKNALVTDAHRINPFEASTFEGTLKAAVSHLDTTGSYEVLIDDVTPPVPSDKLQVTNTWVLFGRKRSGDIFLEDIRRLKKAVEGTAELPNVIRSLVSPGDSVVRARPELPFRGLSSSDSPTGAFELYFPMAYNDEQVSIVQKLASNDGVVVQGPPGTGKTHTIANVICHYLAQGKRVLVTAKGESALAVLQEKLPERIRPLSVALLSNERDGMKQFEHSIQTIASSVASLNPTRAVANIAAAEERLNQLHAKITYVDHTVAEYASKHMRNYMFQGKEILPEAMAKLVLDQAEEFQWFDDEPPPSKDGALPFDEADITALRQARLQVGVDLGYLGCSLPAPDEFPSWPDLLGLHQDLVKAKSIEVSVDQGNIFGLVDSRSETLEKAQALIRFLSKRREIKAKLTVARKPWLVALASHFARMQSSDPRLKALLDICTDIRRLESRRRELLPRAVEVSEDAELHKDFAEAIDRLIAGKSAFALPFGKSDMRKMINAVKVIGTAPATKDDWEIVQQTLSWRVEVRKVLAQWAALTGEFGLEMTVGDADVAFKKIAGLEPYIEAARRLTFEFNASLHARLEEVFGHEAAGRIRSVGESLLETALVSVQAHVDRGRLAYAVKRVHELVHMLEGRSGSIVTELRSFLVESLGTMSTDESVLQVKWLALQMELSRLVTLGSALGNIARVADTIEAAGASKWATRLRTQPASSDLDTMAPVKWREAWNWRQAVIFLDRIDGHRKVRELFEERKTLTTTLARTYQDLVAEKTWLGVYNNSPDSVRQALQAYLNSVQAMGAGTGVRAIRHRRVARAAMERAYQAVPCWVLPQWRVSETIPAELGLFDLVVVDEASQSDIWAMPALLRGKKLLVVGDHKQVSPSAVGAAEEKIKVLINRFLISQPHGSEMTPDKSIYDLARVVFAGNSVMLKEHFRCVPAIIEYSNREFYENDIQALRVPKANERLDPPLVDVFVKGGFRKGDVNHPEAKAIVDEIETILADPQFAGRSIGVVTLHGNTQAAHIHDLVNKRISPTDIVARKIAIGPPPVFQGRERDIMLVSMVQGPGDRGAQNKADMHQRFNVAMSRARDRMYLFRSVSETEFREDSLNGRLIRHFKQPFRQDVRQVQEQREKCESGFEREMFDELVRRGFRVVPQVPCGGYRIDFVVEGSEGRRLAVECDGDRFHGPGQWQDDMTRQRVLERAGWTFWRCFASSFVRHRDVVIADLMQALDRLGIEPLGAESVDSTVWVHSKEVDPCGVELKIDEEQEVV